LVFPELSFLWRPVADGIAPSSLRHRIRVA